MPYIYGGRRWHATPSAAFHYAVTTGDGRPKEKFLLFDGVIKKPFSTKTKKRHGPSGRRRITNDAGIFPPKVFAALRRRDYGFAARRFINRPLPYFGTTRARANRTLR